MRNDVLAVLGKSVKRIRKEQHLSADELARTINISSSELNEVETAKTAIGLEQLVGLSKALNVPMLRLFLSDELPANKVRG